MTASDRAVDPRPQLSAALDQLQHQIDAIGPDDRERPTPCAEYNVRTLLAHIVAVLRKLELVGRDGDMTQVPDPATDLGDDGENEFRRARGDFERTWADDSTLDESRTLPWGTMTGRELLDAYAHEFTVHAWDLSRVTGNSTDLDPALAEAALDWYSRNVPAKDRVEGGPFAPAVPVSSDADAYTRLAAFVGRAV